MIGGQLPGRGPPCWRPGCQEVGDAARRLRPFGGGVGRWSCSPAASCRHHGAVAADLLLGVWDRTRCNAAHAAMPCFRVRRPSPGTGLAVRRSSRTRSTRPGRVDDGVESVLAARPSVACAAAGRSVGARRRNRAAVLSVSPPTVQPASSSSAEGTADCVPVGVVRDRLPDDREPCRRCVVVADADHHTGRPDLHVVPGGRAGGDVRPLVASCTATCPSRTGHRGRGGRSSLLQLRLEGRGERLHRRGDGLVVDRLVAPARTTSCCRARGRRRSPGQPREAGEAGLEQDIAEPCFARPSR